MLERSNFIGVHDLKKIQRHLGEHLKPVKLYYDDILDLIEILKEGGGEIEIEADDYMLDSPDEILSIEKPFFTKLEIRHLNPRISINFESNNIWLYAAEDTPVQRGLFGKVKSLLKEKQRTFATILQSSIYSGLYTGASTWFLFGLLFNETNKTRSIIIGLLMLCTGILWMALGHKSQFRYFSIIVPSKKKESLNYWQRNKDQIIVAFIAAALGIIGTIIVTKIFSPTP